MMVANDTLDTRFSKFTLAVGKDSGWYDIDPDQGEHFFWAKDEGCGIFGSSCPHSTIDELCSESNASTCSDHFLYRTRCTNSSYTGGCHINLNSEWCKSGKTATYDYYKYGETSLCQNLGVEL